MTNTYLLDVIKALKPAERQEMTLFLASPYFNRSGNAKELVRLYQVILHAAPEFQEDVLSKERVYFQIYSEQILVHGKLEKLMTELNKLLRRYALTTRYYSETKEVEQQIDWATWLREHGLVERSEQLLAKMKNNAPHKKLGSLEQYRSDLLIAEEVHLWELTNNQAKGDLNIPNLVHHLDLYYYNYRTELANRYLLQQKVAQLPEGDFFVTEADVYEGKSILLRISKKIYEMLRNEFPTVEETQDLMQVLQRYEGDLSFESLDHSYAYLRNFCTLLINSGKLDFVPVLHQIHKDNLTRGYFSINGKISPHAYINLVGIAIKAKDIEWAKQFIEDYKKQVIGAGEDQFFYGLTLSQCLFAEGKFEEASNYIPDAPSNFHYHHMVRRLELKIYYEMGSTLLFHKMDAFRKYIERTAPKTLSANLTEMDLNFINILIQLSQSPIKDKSRSALLLKRIEEKKLLAERDWLTEKARALG